MPLDRALERGGIGQILRSHICRDISWRYRVHQDVPRRDAGVVRDLLAAAEARDRNFGVATCSNRREEPLFADRFGDVVMFPFMPE